MKTMDAYYLHSDAITIARDAGARAVTLWANAHQSLSGPSGSTSMRPFNPWQMLIETSHPKECAQAAHDAASDLMRVESTIVSDGVILTIGRNG